MEKLKLEAIANLLSELPAKDIPKLRRHVRFVWALVWARLIHSVTRQGMCIRVQPRTSG